jgi:hypothetical protein
MFLLDANAFMEANSLYYAFDLAPGFWTWLEDPDQADQVASVDAIKHEITGGTGQLVNWAQALRAEFWWQDTADTVAAMTRLVQWATDPARPYTQAAVNKFLASGDLRLIAHGLVAGATVVTREQSAPDSKKDIKIPDVCAAFGVACVDPFSAYRAMGLRLVA